MPDGVTRASDDGYIRGVDLDTAFERLRDQPLRLDNLRFKRAP
ncbi:hypothetical protein ACFFYR_33955 [Paraburkholderia dipogonis]